MGWGYDQGSLIKGELAETHISWILISKEYAFKMKKPVKLTFLDLSDVFN